MSDRTINVRVPNVAVRLDALQGRACRAPHQQAETHEPTPASASLVQLGDGEPWHKARFRPGSPYSN